MFNFGRWQKSSVAPDVMMRFIDGDGYKFHRQYTQDAEPLIDHNTRVRNETNGWLPDRSARKVGSIPVTIVHDKIAQWERDGRLKRGDPAYGQALNGLLKEMLRDRDYAKFRTTDHV